MLHEYLTKVKQCNGKIPCSLCSVKGIECFYRRVDGRSLKGKQNFKHISGQIDNQDSSVSNEVLHSELDLVATENTIDDITCSNNLEKSRIPPNLQPLLTFSPGIDESEQLQPNDKGSDISKEPSAEGLPSQNGKHSRLLLNSAGNLRYFGESSPLSLLQECRYIFAEVIGSSNFTNDPSKELVIDEPNGLKALTSIQLPRRSLCDILVNFFKENITNTFYIFDMQYFKLNIIDQIYDNPIRADNSQLCLFHLVLAIGAFFAEISPSCQFLGLKVVSSSEFFDSSLSLMRTSVYDGRLWMVEANFLRYFYYQSSCKRSSSWVHLGIAIRLAQALGLHRKAINEKFDDPVYVTHRRRLWRSLFICDRISSINLGRPLAANDYDWDDHTMNFISDPNENFRLKCRAEISKIAQINGRIVENTYQGGVINMKRANELAIELKSWSLNLSTDLDLTNILRKFKSKNNKDNSLLMLVHISQFYGIMLLCRPFLIYAVVKKLKPETRSELKDCASLNNFCKGSIKSSFLTIKLLNYYMENTADILELFIIINGCLFAAVILGLTLLEQIKQPQPDARYIEVLFATLRTARKVLYNYGIFNATSERWGKNVNDMIEALSDMQNSNINTERNLNFERADFRTFNEEIVAFNNEEIAMNDLKSFQQSFVPSNVDLHFDTFVYNEEIVTLDHNGLSLDVFMYDF